MGTPRRSVTQRHNHSNTTVEEFLRKFCSEGLIVEFTLGWLYVQSTSCWLTNSPSTNRTCCVDTASACLEFSEGDPASWSFTQHPHSADNDYVVQQELAFHSIIFVALSPGSCQTFHYSLFTIFSFQIPQNSCSLSCFSIMFIKHMWVAKYFRLAHVGIFSLKR